MLKNIPEISCNMNSFKSVTFYETFAHVVKKKSYASDLFDGII